MTVWRGPLVKCELRAGKKKGGGAHDTQRLLRVTGRAQVGGGARIPGQVESVSVECLQWDKVYSCTAPDSLAKSSG